MAWEIIAKSTVADLIGVSADILKDEWYDLAVGLIESRSRIHNIATPSLVTETHRIWDYPAITVHKSPILAVSSVTIDGTDLSTGDYSWNGRQIIILRESLLDKNGKYVTVTYSSGTNQTDFAVAACVAFIVKEFASMRTMEGAQSLIQFYQPSRSKATERPLIEWGVHGKIKGIIDSFLGRKLNAI